MNLLRNLSGARIASTVMTLIALLHFQLDIFVRKDTGHILVNGSVLMEENDNDKERSVVITCAARRGSAGGLKEWR